MTKSFLIATVAAFAITAPAQAEQQRERRASIEQSKKDRAGERAARAKAQPRAVERRQAVRPERAIERRQAVRSDRSQQRVVERRQAIRVERAQARSIERRQAIRADRTNFRQRSEIERPQVRNEIRASRIEARQRIQQRAAERRARQVERARPQRVERRRIERQAQVRTEPYGLERRAIVHNRNSERFAAQRQLQRQRKAEIRQRQIEQRVRVADRIEDRRELRRDVRERQRLLARALKRPDRNVGDRIDLRQRLVNRDWFDDYRARRYSRLEPSARYVYDYDYDDGYLYKVNRETNAVAALIPLLGGAFSVAQPLPVGFDSYNVPSAYRSLYYDTPTYQYRYGDGAIYRVDPQTKLIQSVVALLTGQNLGVGQMLPAGYDVYNVPYAYRQRFVDRDDMWYRYSDGYIYGVDPYTRRIQSMYPMSYGAYSVGYPAPSYASYGGYTGYGSYGGYPGFSMPYGYNQLYYGQPGYNYQYANGGIYQVDPATQIIRALVALVTGANLGVGQLLPTGYDVYNVPSGYRSTYFDTPDAWYRYNDGYIYQVDPRSRMIEASIPVHYGGYMVGQPVPAAYPGYAVPAQYSGLYSAAPGYDYRYFDGGIYAIDPQSRIVQSQVALLTGQTFGVGQALPMGYDVYNVPFAYRDRYYDTNDAWYRYADGRIYQVDPATRLIQAVIEAIV